MNIFDPPPETEFNFLSLGAGVQSSYLALRFARGEISGPKLDGAIFADTQSEPKSVMDWLSWLEKEIQRSQFPFPVYRVTNGSVEKDSLRPFERKNNGAGEYMRRLIPLFGIMPNGEKTAAIGRKCTFDYKLKPIMALQKQLAGIKRGQKEVTVTQIVGISWDEVQRMKPSREPWAQTRFPLIESKTRRHQCIDWMRENGYPEPPRSACYFCPFHSDDEWRRLRDNDNDEFKKAIQFDEEIRAAFKKNDKTMKMEVYLHNSCRPLKDIDFDNDADKGQQTWDFMSECEGMCGV